MEKELANNLLTLSDRYCASRDVAETTLGRLCAADGKFLVGIRRGGRTFTAKKYDEVVEWFAGNWPPDAEWPAQVPFPTAANQ